MNALPVDRALAIYHGTIANRTELKGTVSACRGICGRSFLMVSMIRIALPFTVSPICRASIANAAAKRHR
jgi:hypothetical protein